MKNQISNIALEGTCSGDVVGGLLSWTGENLQALLFLKEGTIGRKKNGLPKKEGTLKGSPNHNLTYCCRGGKSHG
jgi:hypothetical protein